MPYIGFAFTSAALDFLETLPPKIRRQVTKKAKALHAGNNVQFGIRYGSDAEKERFANHMANAAARVKAEMIADAEDRRDDLLRRYAAELDQLRAILPSLAAKLSIEIGEVARHLKQEANGGPL